VQTAGFGVTWITSGTVGQERRAIRIISLKNVRKALGGQYNAVDEAKPEGQKKRMGGLGKGSFGYRVKLI